MPSVTVGDSSISIHQFQSALQVSTLFLRHISRFDPPVDSRLTLRTLLQSLDDRWQLLQEVGDKQPAEYSNRVRRELSNLAKDPGYELFKRIAADLKKPFDWKHRLLEASGKALEQVRLCVHEWGGAKAKARLSSLRALPIHCETTGDEQTIYFFDREKTRLVVRPGSLKLMLFECTNLEFSFFHEYLSHFFPSWSLDKEEVSEGFLFALEFEWYQHTNTPFDDELLEVLWNERLRRGDRGHYRLGQWLLRRRCTGVQDCFGTFLLEWVAQWSEHRESVHEDVISQLSGIANRITSRFTIRPKDMKLLDLLRDILCAQCSQGDWNLNTMRSQFAAALQPYGVPK